MLRARGFTVTTARDSEQLGRSDEEQLTFATDASSVLLTHNRVDFERLHRSWLDAGRPHADYNVARPHQALDDNSPQPRDIDLPPGGRIITFPQARGLHHRYQRAA